LVPMLNSSRLPCWLNNVPASTAWLAGKGRRGEEHTNTELIDDVAYDMAQNRLDVA
jgi:hypothetical protein